jgi:GrpB-like predicted nucleotidyltransferase (UPF0157 family)
MRIIEVVSPDAAWKERFATEARSLRQRLGALLVADIEHIGSTAVGTIAAKPIIDIQVVVSSLTALSEAFRALPSYLVHGDGGIPGHLLVIKGDHDVRHCHIHGYETGHPDIGWNLWFRDHLLRHPDLAREYQRVKQIAAYECQHDITRYMQLKAGFILAAKQIYQLAHRHGPT